MRLLTHHKMRDRHRAGDGRSWRGSPGVGRTSAALLSDHDQPHEHDASERIHVAVE